MDATLNNGDLLDVIAALTSRSESGRLQINVPGSAGAFFFKNGKLVDARMGPFSGFPAINYAVSLGQATLKFDSSVQPPALTSTAIASNERVLIKERFGIETIDSDSPGEDQPNEIDDAKLPISIGPQALVAEAAPTLVAKPLRTPAYSHPRQDEIRYSARARESRRRTARSRRAVRKEKEPQIADGLSNQAIEQVGKNIEQQKSVESEVGTSSQLTSSATSKPATEARRRIETPQSAKPIEIIDPLLTRKLTGCQNATNRTIIGIPWDDTSFSPAAKPGSAKPRLFWTLIIIIFLVSFVLGYYISSNLSREKVAASPRQAEVNPPPSPDADQPIVGGSLHGKEAVLQKPEYPARARTEGVSGKVTVAIVVNRQGRVVSARALTGAPLLKAAAVAAARQSKFLPDNLQRSNSGTIAYTFRL